MAYVLNVDLTPEYIQTLIDRNGYVLLSTPDPTDPYTQYNLQDLDGAVTNCWGMISARNFLVDRYVIMQNS